MEDGDDILSYLTVCMTAELGRAVNNTSLLQSSVILLQWLFFGSVPKESSIKSLKHKTINLLSVSDLRKTTPNESTIHRTGTREQPQQIVKRPPHMSPKDLLRYLSKPAKPR
ncbi:uncharacterized protein DFL_009622 [Arthrobotrys flagrans]|uniref:Uncharacterized protein n=1 Tax=Arthrobotrys flagrans TaxID=97331 RepID=A0A436ZSR0_ARTFL|nr:hypothetical protein DFL_009622 [Arthrobotrys flagrans]